VLGVDFVRQEVLRVNFVFAAMAQDRRRLLSFLVLGGIAFEPLLAVFAVDAFTVAVAVRHLEGQAACKAL
jgi:hypothetical protein